MKTIQIIRRVLGIEKIAKKQEDFQRSLSQMNGIQKEILKAHLLTDATCESNWLKYKSFSPNGWALTYNALYFLYKTLDTIHPTNILEFGLGQSSKMIYQYTHTFPTAHAITYEHDVRWIEFFTKEFPSGISPNIYKTETVETEYNKQKTLSYINDIQELIGQQFDFILVDGPYGSEHYSRSQILHIIPQCLKSSFVIMIDDAERNGEQETIHELLNILHNSNIKVVQKTFSSTKSFYVICSPDLKFILTI